MNKLNNINMIKVGLLLFKFLYISLKLNFILSIPIFAFKRNEKLSGV